MCSCQLLIFAIFLLVLLNLTLAKTDGQQYCSFFNNRAPKAQPGLKNCTWFKDNSCCMQQEIEATFGRVKPLQGASPTCLKYINYLMCYICAPNQNIFYKRERLTVCGEFCDILYEACGSAILKGSLIGKLYGSGTEFCESRRFIVSVETCFTFNPSMDINAVPPERANIMVIVSMFFLCYLMQETFSLSPSVCFEASTADKSNRKNFKYGQKRNHRENLKKKKVDESQDQCKEERDSSKTLIISMKHKHSMGRLHGHIPRWLDSAFIAIMLCIFHLPQGTGALTTDDIKMWTQLLSSDLTELAKKGLRYDEIQQLYDRAKYATEYVNGTEKILQVRAKLGTCTTTYSSIH